MKLSTPPIIVSTCTTDGRSHVIPSNDSRSHWATIACWCSPSILPDNEAVAVHNANDYREFFMDDLEESYPIIAPLPWAVVHR